MELSEVSLICKALSDQNQLQIIYFLTYGEQCACELLEKIEQHATLKERLGLT